MRPQLKKPQLMFISSFLFSMMLFQCAPEGSGILGLQSTNTDLPDPRIVNSPFAYDVAFDTISHNSCSVFSPVDDFDLDLFGFKIGVNEGFADTFGSGAVKAGLKLRSDFLQYVGSTFTPEYPSGTITPEQIQKILLHDDNVVNKDPKIQVSIRKVSNLESRSARTMNVPSGQYGLPGHGNEVPFIDKVLGAGLLGFSLAKDIQFTSTGTVLAEGSRIYNLSNTPEPVNIEASLPYNTFQTQDGTQLPFTPETWTGPGEAFAQKIRDDFTSNKHILAAAFGGTFVRSPDDSLEAPVNDHIDNLRRPFTTTGAFDSTKAYGRGYRLNFAAKTPVNSFWPRNQLVTVNEFLLENNAPASGVSWSCQQFAITRKEDFNNNKAIDLDTYNGTVRYLPNCMPLRADDMSCSSSEDPGVCARKLMRFQQVKMIRRHYNPEKWNIGLLYTGAYHTEANLSINTHPDSITLRNNAEICIAPKFEASCYPPTSGILETGTNAEKSLDIGIQYDRLKDCYTTSNTYSGTRDNVRKHGRCAQYASICTRTSSGF